MRSVLKWSIVLAAAVAVCSVIFVAAGMHKNPVAGTGFIGVAIVLNAAAVVLALRGTARENAYGRQLLNGVLLGAIAGSLIFVASWLLHTVVFPDSIPELREGMAAFVRELSVPDSQKEQQLASVEQITAASQAVEGFLGTLLTSAVLGAIAGAFLRKR